MRAWRWKSEGYKVDFYFPLALNYSFVVLVFIELETKLMELCGLLRDLRHSSFSVKDITGRGVEKYALYIERVGGIKRSELKYWEQIAALQQIRNCIVHTAGFIAQARDSVNLREMVMHERFFVPDRRSHAVASRLNEPPRDPGVSIIQFNGMERLIVKMEYPHTVSFYVRHFLLDLVEKIEVPPSSSSKARKKKLSTY